LTRALDAKLRRQRLFDLAVKLLQTRTKTRPLMLVIEDAQRADPASMDLIDYVARNLVDYPVLFILPHRANEGLPDWTTYPHATSISLGELTSEDCLAIVKGMIGSVALPASLTQIILDKSDGNPFFVEEVVRALIDTKALQQRADRQWELAQAVNTIELPDTIHGLIISRIDRLLETDRRVLQVASVVGRVFARRLLDGVYPYGALEGTLTRRLDHLGGLGLTEIQSLEEELYRFRHATTWDVVYGSQAFEQRRNLHRRIANFIENEYTDSPGEQIELLAYHYWEGHSWAKAMDYNLLAGQRAQREFANDTAVTAYQRALEAAAKLDRDTRAERLPAHESLGEVLTLLGQYDQALQHYQDALSLTDDDRRRTDICRKTADVFERRGEYDTAFEWLEKGLSYLGDAETNIEVARIYLLGAGVYRRQVKNDEAIDWCQRCLDALSSNQTRDAQQVVAQAYYNLGGIYTYQGDLQSAVQYCQESVRVYQEIDDIVGLSQAYVNLSNAYCDLGDWGRGSEALRQSLEMKERIGDVLYQGIIANNLAQLELDRGDWEQAGALFEQSYAIWNQVGATAFKGITLSNLAQVHINQGYWDKARHCLQQSQTIFAQVGTEEYLPELERRWAEFHIHTLELESALEHAQRSVKLAAAQEARLEEGLSYRTLGQVHFSRNEKDLAQDTLRQSLEILQSMDSEFEAARTAVDLAQVEIEVSPDAAGKRLESAIQIFEKLGAQADLAKARSIKKQL